MLGLDAGADAGQILAARRRLAKELHPDRGGDSRRMQDVNEATAEALATVHGVPTAPAPGPAMPPDPASTAPSPRRADRRIVEDQPSFVVEALPVVAFSVLATAAARLGTAIDGDPPHILEVVLDAPLSCWCRLELLPEGASTSVGVVLVGLDGGEPPEVEEVRDAWIAAVNETGSPAP